MWLQWICHTSSPLLHAGDLIHIRWSAQSIIYSPYTVYTKEGSQPPERRSGNDSLLVLLLPDVYICTLQLRALWPVLCVCVSCYLHNVPPPLESHGFWSSSPSVGYSPQSMRLSMLVYISPFSVPRGLWWLSALYGATDEFVHVCQQQLLLDTQPTSSYLCVPVFT